MIWIWDLSQSDLAICFLSYKRIVVLNTSENIHLWSTVFAQEKEKQGFFLVQPRSVAKGKNFCDYIFPEVLKMELVEHSEYAINVC